MPLFMMFVWIGVAIIGWLASNMSKMEKNADYDKLVAAKRWKAYAGDLNPKYYKQSTEKNYAFQFDIMVKEFIKLWDEFTQKHPMV